MNAALIKVVGEWLSKFGLPTMLCVGLFWLIVQMPGMMESGYSRNAVMLKDAFATQNESVKLQGEQVQLLMSSVRELMATIERSQVRMERGTAPRI